MRTASSGRGNYKALAGEWRRSKMRTLLFGEGNFRALAAAINGGDLH